MAIVIFLLGKVKVTNGSRKIAIWETGVLWLSRVYAWAYSPIIAIASSVTYPGGTNEEETHCYNGFSGSDSEERSATDNAIGYSGSNAALMIQFMLLMVLFVKPLLVPVEGTQSGGASYRRVVMKNVVCTVSIVMAYLVTTIVTAHALLNETPDDNANSQVADPVPMINQLVTLCLTEIALPLGFSSCWKTCSSVYRAVKPTVKRAQVDKVEAVNGANSAMTTTAITTKVVPVQG